MGRFKLFFLTIVAAAGLVLGGCGDDNDTIVVVPYNGKYLYVNNSTTANAVSGFAIKSNGTLEELVGSPFVTGGIGSADFYAANPIAIAVSKKLLFATNTTDSTVTSFTINSNTGELTAVGLPVPSGGTMGSSGSLVVDDNENFLFVGNATTGDVSVLSIASNGELIPVGLPFALNTDVDGMTLNAVGTTLYIASPSANTLIVLNVAANGTLSHIAGSPFPYAVGGVVTSFALSSSTLGLAAATSGYLSSYDLDANGAPTLLSSVLLGGNSQSVTTTRRGKLAILSGGSNAVISMVQVATDGILTPVAGSPFATAMQTSGYAIANPSGKYLYATEGIFEGDSQIEAFAIDSAGALTSINTYPLTNSGFATGLVVY